MINLFILAVVASLNFGIYTRDFNAGCAMFIFCGFLIELKRNQANDYHSS